MLKSCKKKLSVIIISVVLIFSSSLLLYCNFYLQVETIDIYTDKLSDSFNNYRIAHISDYHNRASEMIDKQIIDSLTSNAPDIIVVTGDLVDYLRTDVDIALAFVEKLCKIAPVYYVTGNHEATINIDNEKQIQKLIDGLTLIGVTVLRNSSVEIVNENSDSFNLYGIEDPYFYGNYTQVYQRTEKLCQELNMSADEYNALLAHHPETLSVYSKFNIDLVFSGHAHGGQVTFFGKAIVAPDQVYFPPYTEGLYKIADTQMVLSRGIGYSSVPIRFFSNPHLIYTEFKTNQ